MNGSNPTENFHRVLGRVSRQDFVGRRVELNRVLEQANRDNNGRGLLLLLEPAAGVSELLRQVYDQLFNERSEVIPIYFAFNRNETTAVSAAIEFLNGFLQQFIAFRRNEPALCHAALTLQDLVQLAPPSDLEWIEQVVRLYEHIRFSKNNKELVRFCLGVPQRMPARVGRPFVMLDGSELAEYLNDGVVLGTEVLRVFDRSGLTFVVAGLRRQVLEAAHDVDCNFERLDTLKLEQLKTDEAHQLVNRVARRQQVPTSREAESLIVQQFAGSPFFISVFFQAAREKNTALVSYLDCERLYVDELLGGHLHHHFDQLLEEMAPHRDTRMTLTRLLWEAIAAEERQVHAEGWRKRLHLSEDELEEVLHRLHIQEFVNWSGPTFDATTGSQVWKDYLKTQYRLDVLSEPRALVVADMLADSLKRAPNTMAMHYKQLAQFGLRELMAQFDCQRVPAILFDYASFSEKYKGLDQPEVVAALEADADSLKLPQVVHVASSMAFNSEMRQVCEEEKCVVVHAFEDGVYSDAQEVVWLVVEVDSKLEVANDLAQIWFERLDSMARMLGFRRYQVWLVSNEGFSDEAGEFLKKQKAYFSSKHQLDLLVGRIGEPIKPQVANPDEQDEFLMVVPMGEDNELIAASTVEHIARRLTFHPGAINQIKTAIVEACINASEHSYSPDRKIYQRFRVESDRLVVTISSRGIVPTNVGSGNNTSPPETDEAREERRGWGLKLIRTLMDEVEFERVDDGTSLRMTKYLRKAAGSAKSH
jgi:serine/threonine-protein kinase RsbW